MDIRGPDRNINCRMKSQNEQLKITNKMKIKIGKSKEKKEGKKKKEKA